MGRFKVQSSHRETPLLIIRQSVNHDVQKIVLIYIADSHICCQFKGVDGVQISMQGMCLVPLHINQSTANYMDCCCRIASVQKRKQFVCPFLRCRIIVFNGSSDRVWHNVGLKKYFNYLNNVGMLSMILLKQPQSFKVFNAINNFNYKV